jgi:hypothetical protein
MSAHPKFSLLRSMLGLGLALAGLVATVPERAAAAEKAPDSMHLRPQMVFLRVQVGPDGKIGSSNSLDPNTAPVLVQTAQQVLAKVNFAPATKDGRAVASETSLVMTLAFVPQNGGFGVTLKRAQNGPNALQVGAFQQPKVNRRENGGVITVSADLRADGTVDMETYKVDKAELRVPATFAQEQFEKAARFAMKGAKFQLDKVDGVEIPSRVTVPFTFNGGAMKPTRGERGDDEEQDEGKDKDGAKRPPRPLISATSLIEGVVLPKYDYTAPGPAAEPEKK